MLALWVAASSESTLRAKACLAALDIRTALQLFDQSSNAVKLRTRIGLHCGHILLGHIGALDHYEYSPMGDIVNTAARIDSLNKKLGASMLVSDEVIHQLDGFLTRELGTFRLAGKVKPVVVHELLGHREESSDETRRACAIFTEALSTFRRQAWDEAAEKFHQCMKTLGEDGPSHFYLGLCEKYRAKPPAEPWDGLVRMDEK
jgi:adenylate cyclase